MLISFKLGQGSIVLRVKIRNSSVSTGAGLTGLTSASSGLIISTIADNEATATAYTVAGSTIESITTLGTYSAPTATKCRFKEVDATNHKGIYEIQIADARFAVSSAKSVLISISGATNAAECDALVPLRSVDPYDAVRGGMTALPNANAEAAGGLYTRGTGAGQIKQTNNGEIDSNVTHINNVATTSVTTVNANVGTTQPVNFTGTGTTAYAKVDVIDWNSSGVTASAGTPDVNIVKINGLSASGVSSIGANIGTTQPVNFTGSDATAYVKVDVIDAAGIAWGSGAITAASIAAAALNGKGDWLLSSGYTAPLDAAGIRSAVGLATANLDNQLSTIDNDVFNVPDSVWGTLLPGSYIAGRAGYIVGTFLNAVVAPASTALSSAVYTNARAANLDNLDAAVTSRAATGDAMTLAAGAITDATITFPAEAAGRPTTFLAAMRRLWEWTANKRIRTRSTGAVQLRNAGDTADLETQVQSTAGGVGSEIDTQSKGV